MRVRRLLVGEVHLVSLMGMRESHGATRDLSMVRVRTEFIRLGAAAISNDWQHI